MKQDIPEANQTEGKIYLFSDGKVYETKINESFYNNDAYKYSVTKINATLAKVIYSVHNQVKFSKTHNAMEFQNTEHFNKYVQQEGYGAMKELMNAFGIKEGK